MATGLLDFPVLLTPEETAKKLGRKESTLATWRSTGRHGLRFVRSGSRILYRLDDVLAFIDSRTGTETTPVRQPRDHAHNAGIAAMHLRWHVKRGVVNPKCTLCQQVHP